ncbi:hypothetical protein [Nocardioides sp.]|uniref:hypothetical protein n=1 Tax=Nocardioides sp. TaxID=35761 RepID=UPI0037844FE7
MIVWIIVGVVVVALAVFAFWPRRRGVQDAAVREGKGSAAARGQNESNRSGPQFNGPVF